MINFLLILTALSYGMPSIAETVWSNPPVLCPEEILPQGLPCPDLTNVKNPYTDFSEETTPEEIKNWKLNKAADLKLCRNLEVLRRENVKAGSYEAGTLETAWMVVDGGKRVAEKLIAFQNASAKYGVSPQILIGAMTQESLLSTLGISPDGGNYSCGMAQLNIQEWCQSMNKLSKEKRESLGWPDISCEDKVLPNDIIKPLYDIAVKKMGNRPVYQISSLEFKNITYRDVAPGIFSKSKMNRNSFKAAMSFVNNCQDIALSVSAKAQTLSSLFNNFVPKSLQEAEHYLDGQTFSRNCKNNYAAPTYPLHTGWLLAVAMYNAGPVQAKTLAHYYQVHDNKFPELNPLDLIEALHWGGKWKEGTTNLEIRDQDGNAISQKWFKSCVVQRHVARVIQYVTIPGESIAKSLELEGCKMDIVPEYRKNSSGIKEKL